MNSNSLQRLDIVVPLYNEIDVVAELHRQVVAACRECSMAWRIVYVDDGSHDGTGRWITENAAPDEDVLLLTLSRNFGQPAAINAGLSQTEGAGCVVVMDGDLQDPPVIIPDLVSQWRQGIEVVIAKRRSRRETFWRGLAFGVFHRFFQYLSDSRIPRNTGTFCLLDQRAVAAIGRMDERHRFFPGLRSWVGFRQKLMPFDRQARAAGVPKQTFRRLFRYAMDAIFGYSLKPLRLLTMTGALICTISFLLAVFFVSKRMVGMESATTGFTTMICAVFGLGGFQLIGMGILGEYIGRIYDEVKNRPHFIIADEFRSQQSIKTHGNAA